jgi:hypothetical protein
MDALITHYGVLCLDKFKQAIETETVMTDIPIRDMWCIVFLHKFSRYCNFGRLHKIQKRQIIQQAAEYTLMVEHIFKEYPGCLPRVHPLETLDEVQRRIQDCKIGAESVFITSLNL